MRATPHIPSLLAVVALFAFASCASGNPAGTCDPAETPGCEVDGSVSPFADAGATNNADAGPERGFGEPCSDRSECASNFCILVGIGGVCSDYCTDGMCPEGYGCFGVIDVIEPGEVDNVCVPTSTQLCSPCEMDSECAIVGSDLCLTNADERSFCARDCSTISCPDGFTCSDVEVEGAMYKQCLPSSGACDCTDTETGTIEDCAIPTDFGDCTGSRTCAGTTGWDTCQPPAQTDGPDGLFIDDNCDGIDGDLNGAIFVATNGGTDSSTCGLTYTDPCATIGFSIIRALQAARGELYVQAGDYNEVVVLVNGIDIYGGYDTNWQRDVHTDSEHRVTITGAQDSGTGGDDEFLTIRAHNLVVSTTVADVVIVGPEASGTTISGARSSYAIHVDDAIIDLQRVSVVGGNGEDASSGAVGLPTSSAGASTAMRGGVGGNANEFTTSCNDSSHGNGGSAGTNSCSGTRNPNGGRGGDGGEMDTDCDCVFGACVCGPCAATAGDGGTNAAHTFGTLGLGGNGGSGGGSCGVPTPPGRDGRIQNGSAGSGATGNGFLSGSYWFARSGGSGGVGQNGGGGGGGGGSGGCDDGIDSHGAGGGGGGAGGCAASAAGGGGVGGGGSFGIFVAGGASLTASDCTIARGVGGNGGNGGNGGHGQVGGAGRSGGLADGDSKAGSVGGDGAHGGHGGGGGGGGGGISAGIFSFQSTVVEDCVVTGGSAGVGGAGGISAPVAPVAIRDGNNGAAGIDGALESVAECTGAGGC